MFKQKKFHNLARNELFAPSIQPFELLSVNCRMRSNVLALMKMTILGINGAYNTGIFSLTEIADIANCYWYINC